MNELTDKGMINRREKAIKKIEQEIQNCIGHYDITKRARRIAAESIYNRFVSLGYVQLDKFTLHEGNDFLSLGWNKNRELIKIEVVLDGEKMTFIKEPTVTFKKVKR